MTRLAAALLLSAALIAPASARECLTQRQFDRAVHKVKVARHCWRAVETPRPMPRIAHPVLPAEVEVELPAEPYPIGQSWTPDPERVLPAWRVGEPTAVFRVAPSRNRWDADEQRSAGHIFGLFIASMAMGSAAAYAGWKRRWQIRVTDSRPLNPEMIPRVIGAGVNIGRRAW